MRSLLTLLAALLAAPVAAQPVPCEDGVADEYPCSNVTFLSRIDVETMGAEAGNDVWGWTDPYNGKEYALMGLANGTAFIDVSDPANPAYLGKLPTHTTATVWRDVKVYADHAFIVSEADGHGMQVFDLARLRDVAPTQGPVTFEADAHYDRVGQSHNIAINEETGFAYIVGNREAEGCNGGLHVVDVRNPLAPSFAGCFAEDGYTHDVQCVVYDGPDAEHAGKEICVASNEDTVTIVDVTDKQNPVELSQAIYPNPAYTHQGWLTDDHRFFIGNDELDEMRFGNTTRSLIFDVSDLDNPEFVGPHLSESPSIDHNLYVRGDRVYEANYRSGLRILDVSNVAEGELEEVAFFDTFPENDDAQFGGAWSTYPYFASGTVLISDMQRGLFVVRPEMPEPMPLATLDAFAYNGGVDLSWTVDESAEPATRFVVEREANGRWIEVGRTRAVPSRTTYRFRIGGLTDGEHALRVRAVTTSGEAAFSEPVTASLGTAGALSSN